MSWLPQDSVEDSDSEEEDWLPREGVEDSDSEEDSDCQLVGPRDGQEESSGHIVFDSASAGVSRGKSVKWQEEQVIDLSVLYPAPGYTRMQFLKKIARRQLRKKLNSNQIEIPDISRQPVDQ